MQRSLFSVAFSKEWGRQMRIITGPRQCGKTTLAKQKLEADQTSVLYYLWDLRSVRERYKANELFFTQDSPPVPGVKQWVCFDEIHKIPKWKNVLKGVFDSTVDHYQFIITGSAKLNIFKKAGDSLAGRYFTFHLYPLGLWELSPIGDATVVSSQASTFILEQMNRNPVASETLTQLLEFGGFPDPFLQQSSAYYATWKRDYMDVVIKEDIGSLTRIIDKENLHDVYNLLPDLAGSPISESSIASHLQLTSPTIKNYLRRLDDFYLAFKVHPYSKNIKRAILKAPKCYLYDWGRIEDPGKRFENFMAVQISARLSLWQEKSGDVYSLFYIRTKLKEETDFLILKNKKPWLMVEAKLSDGSIEGHQFKIQSQLGNIPFVQVSREEGIAKLETKNATRLSASRFLA